MTQSAEPPDGRKLFPSRSANLARYIAKLTPEELGKLRTPLPPPEQATKRSKRTGKTTEKRAPTTKPGRKV
jgi:hypothetical protein